MIDIVWSPRGWINSFHSRLANNKQQGFKKTEYIIEQYAEENMKQESIKAYEKKNIKSNTVC